MVFVNGILYAIGGYADNSKKILGLKNSQSLDKHKTSKRVLSNNAIYKWLFK